MSERITGHTELLTLFGYPIRHSNSPKMHNTAAAALGLDYAYLCFDVDQDELEGAMSAFRALKVRGGNITMPNKMKVIPLLDELSESAAMVGAVNTVLNDNGRLIGYNTDGLGYVLGLKDRGIDPAGKKIVIAGCGGAGKPMEIELALSGAKEIAVFNIHDSFWKRAEETVAIINEKTGCKAALYDLDDKELLRKEIETADILANATCVGMGELEGQTWLPDTSFLRKDLIVTEVIYSPAETAFLKMAREVGCENMNGMPMMLFQGAAAFKIWTGQDMPIDVVKAALGFDKE